ncbi:hypothetical protein WJX81_005506 [Elliptochloris bilobata]|uniref:EamA domain-containing protein n=1 Tax=Elliptochloris bilobata TaxID=381761 RepID=A0AAW1RJN5_9CHLO
MDATCEDAGSESGPALPPTAAPSALEQLGALLLLISPFFFWGTSMVAMKELAPHTAPLFVAAVRLLPAGAVLVAWGAAQGRAQPKGRAAWAAIAAFALADGACFQGFLAEGLQRTSAGLGSVIIDSQPLTVAALAALLLGERLSAAGVAGLGVGVAGLCLLEVPPELLASFPIAAADWVRGVAPAAEPALSSAAAAASAVAAAAGPSGWPWSLWDSGEWWMLLAAQSMAVGTVMVPWVTRRADPIMATGWHMLLGGLPLLALAAAREGPLLATRLPQLTGADLALLAYVSLLGSAASYGVFFLNASRGNLTALSSLTFLTPVFAAGAGYLALGETLTPLQLAGAGVTLGAVYLINARRGDEAA